MLKNVAPLGRPLFLIACDPAETPSDSFPDDGATNTGSSSSSEDGPINDDSADSSESDPARPLSDKPISKKDLSRLNDLIRFAPNSLHAQYLYCTDSHWRKKTSRNAKKNGIGRKLSYDDAAERCEEFAEIFSQCLATQGFDISPNGLKKDFGYIEFYRDKYKENYSIQTTAFVNRKVMEQKAVCSFTPNCDAGYRAGYDQQNRDYCQKKNQKKINEDDG